jgi:hypothetical protein
MKRIPRSLLVVSLLLASLLANRCLLADELPENLGNVHSLSLQQAKTLVAEFKLNGSLPDGANGLFLRGLETLSVETAKTLSEFAGPFIELNGLTSLDAATAKAIGKYKGHLSLDGLTDLPVETANGLAESSCDVLTLNGVTTLSADAAAELARFRGKWLYMNGMDRISPDAAGALAKFRGEILSLQGLAGLSPEAAQGLAAYTGPPSGPNATGRLYLNGLTKLSAEAASELAAFPGETMILGMPEISPEVARALAHWDPGRKNPAPGVIGSLQFPNLKSLSQEAAKAIAEAKCGSLVLGGERFEIPDQPRLMTLDAGASQALGGFKGKGKVRFGNSLHADGLPAK